MTGLAEGDTGRPAAPVLRWTFGFAAALVVVTGVQLTAFPGNTDDAFAWTVRPPLTAAFLGAAYLGAFAFLGLSALERRWACVRPAVVAATVFVPLMFAATLIHLDRFHLGAGSATGRVAGWGWLLFYVAVVVVIPAGVAWQLATVRGSDAPRATALPTWTRVALAAVGVALAALGVALFVSPTGASAAWPWELTPLTGRAVGSWCAAIGATTAAAAIEADARRLRAFAAFLAVGGVVQLAAVARFSGTLDWDGAGAWCYLAVLVAATATGMAVTPASLRAARR